MTAPNIEPETAREIPQAQQAAVEALEKKMQALEVELIRESTKRHTALYKERKALTDALPNFWAQVFLNLKTLSIYLDHSDVDAFKYLADFDIERMGEDGDPRPMKLHFTFSENPYFSDKVLTKEFTLAPGAPPLTPEFNPEEELSTTVTPISWKDDEHNLAKKAPMKGAGGEDDFEPGSIFSCFFGNASAAVCATVASIITERLWPNAVEIYTGDFDDSEPHFIGFDSDEDEDEEDDDEEDDEEDPNAEIDLEEPPKKKSKN